MAEPEKFYIGMIDFFSILLPGSIITYALRELAKFNPGIPKLPPPASDAEAWAVFLVVAYVLGHFAFLIGSFLDKPYDWIRDHCFGGATGSGKNVAVDEVLRLKRKMAGDAGMSDKAMNAFQWAKCRLALESPAVLNHVNRFEADSKFFRSFTVVALALVWALGTSGFCGYAATSALFACLSFWRYCDQRFKSTQQAYWYLLTLHTTPTTDSESTSKALRL